MKKLLLLIALISTVSNASEVIGVAESKGLFFKDTLKVLAFNDPSISGIACYTTKYSKTFSLSDSTNSSIACRQIGKVTLDKSLPQTTKGVFVQSKGFIFTKDTVVDRFIDFKRNVIIYLSYTKSMGGENASHSVSVVAIK